jgi:hypothetical protein
MNAERCALVVIEIAFIGLALFILLGGGLWVFGAAKDIYVKATERLHRRKMETFDKLIALEKARNGSLS